MLRSILYTLNEKDWDFLAAKALALLDLSIYSIYLEWKGLRHFLTNSYELALFITYLNLFYIPWMKRIETDNQERWHSSPAYPPIPSILYTLNEKDWDPFCNATCGGVAGISSILYTLNEKDWDTHLLIRQRKHWYYLFYIPWMKRIETYGYTLNR